MTDYTELKRLAEAAPEGPWFGPEYAPGTSYVFDVDLGTLLEYQSIDSEKDACLRYVAAANPAMVLALIAENERLAAACERAEQVINAESKSAAIATGRANLLQAERDQLKAENVALLSTLKGMTSMYGHCWDLVDGGLLCMQDNVQRFEDAHEAAQKVIAAMGKGE
ncbi:hypothetical protein ACM9HO_07475 [Pseudomonas sp. KHB2.9]